MNSWDFQQGPEIRPWRANDGRNPGRSWIDPGNKFSDGENPPAAEEPGPVKPTPLDEDRLETASTDEIHAALFGQLVAGHAQMALILLGRMPHPETGQPAPASPADAKMFIDQLEMLESRTRGNLTGEEARILTQALTVTRQAFAELIDAGLEAGESSPANEPPR